MDQFYNGKPVEGVYEIKINDSKDIEITAIFGQITPEYKDTGSVKIYGEAENGYIEDHDGDEIGKKNYAGGSTVVLTAVADPGYRFAGWEIDPDADEYLAVATTGNTAKIRIPETLPGDLDAYPLWIDGVRVTAYFEPIPAAPSEPTPTPTLTTYYTLNVDVEGPGSVAPASGSYAAGSRVVLLPTADEGARFVGWSGENGPEVDSYNGILMDGSKKLIAVFEVIAFDETDDGSDIEEEFTDDNIPGSGDINDEDEDVVLDQEVPYGGETLPQTGLIPMELFMGAGLTLITAGFSLLKKKDEEE